MNQVDATMRHSDVYLAGFRALAVAVGRAQLIKELRQSGESDSTANDRIRDALADELTVARPVRQPADELREGVKPDLIAFSGQKEARLNHEWY